MAKAVVLLSGGLDSSTVLAICISQGFDAHALTLDYSQRHSVEIGAATRISSILGAKQHKIVSVDLKSIGGSALTDEVAVPKDRHEADLGDIPVTYVPARNTLMLALALGYAEVIGADDIFIGVNAVDYSGYPDCRQEFIHAFEKLANVATKRGVEGHFTTIHTPLIDLTKTQIIEIGLALGVDYGLSHSCYDPGLHGHPCGHCDACLIRVRAFAELGMEDPALVAT